ncbi:MAG: GAF domain-containing protein [Gammaproteobacteria bacterium]|nr:GAF domain-containing protein [Gammaproteobacteria bacterium]MDH3412210.1 GAF domain-containing protein [Gammaproteobacteria bacterium]
MALPSDDGFYGQVLSFAAAKNSLDEGKTREEFHRLNAQAEATRHFINALGTLSDYGQDPPGEVEVMEALDHALACVIKATWAYDGALLISDDSSGDLIFALVQGEMPKTNLLWRRVPAGRGVAHWAASHKRATIVNNTVNDERFYKGIDAAINFCTRSILAVPLLNGDETIGVLEIINKKDGQFFSLSDQNHLTIMARLATTLLTQLRENQSV